MALTARPSEEHDGPTEWGVAGRAFPGESESGDRCVVTRTLGGLVLAVIDGLGHGPEAARAASTVAATFRDHAATSLAERVRACDTAARGTRGAVLTAVRIEDDGLMTWLGVGNVAGALWRAGASGLMVAAIPPLRNGVVGFNLPVLSEQQVGLEAGDLVVIATDGIADADRWGSSWQKKPGEIADLIVADCARDADDALVLVARYAGAHSAP